MKIDLYTYGKILDNGQAYWSCTLSTILKNEKIHKSTHYGRFKRSSLERVQLAAIIYGLMEIRGSHDIVIWTSNDIIRYIINNGELLKYKRHEDSKIVNNKDMWNTISNLLFQHKTIIVKHIQDNNILLAECHEMINKQDDIEIDTGFE